MSWILPNNRSDFMQEVQSEMDLAAGLSSHSGGVTKRVPAAAECYQCGKCTAGCPVAYEMDYPPHQVMRAVQLGMRDAVLSSHTIWICAACETCSERCPQNADPAGVMDALRRIAYSSGVKSVEPDVPLFHRIFLGTVQQFGRVFEAGMIGLYNLFSGHYSKDVALAPKMLLKGKLNLLPGMHGDRQVLKEIFKADRELRATAGRAQKAKKREAS